MALVSDRTDAHPITLGAHESLGLVVFRIKLGKAITVSAFGDDLARVKSDACALFEAGETIKDVARPA